MGYEVKTVTFGGVNIEPTAKTEVQVVNGQKIYSVYIENCKFSFKEQDGKGSIIHYDNENENGMICLTDLEGVEVETSFGMDVIELSGCRNCKVDLTVDDSIAEEVYVHDSENNASNGNSIIFDKEGIPKKDNLKPVELKDQVHIVHSEDFHEHRYYGRYDTNVIETETKPQNTASYTWKNLKVFWDKICSIH